MTDPNAIPKMQAFATMEQMADLRSQLANAKHLREIITPHDNDCAFMQGGRMACNCNGTRWFGYAHRDTVDVLGVWALCNWFAAPPQPAVAEPAKVPDGVTLVTRSFSHPNEGDIVIPTAILSFRQGDRRDDATWKERDKFVDAMRAMLVASKGGAT